METNDTWKGGAALDAHLKALYGEPVHVFKSAVPTDDLLKETHVFKESDGVWVYVSYGNTGLDGNETPEAGNGAGYELILRVKGPAEAPAEWPVRAFNELMNYSFDEGFRFDAYQVEQYAFDMGEAPLYTALIMVPDAKVQTLNSPNGEVLFYTIVPLTAEEYESVAKDGISDEEYKAGAKALVEKLQASRGQLLVTDPKVAS